jgi:hypothetical protein
MIDLPHKFFALTCFVMHKMTVGSFGVFTFLLSKRNKTKFRSSAKPAEPTLMREFTRVVHVTNVVSLVELILDVAVVILGGSVAPLVALLVVELVRANRFYFSCESVGETNRTCAFAGRRGEGRYLVFFGDLNALFACFLAVFTFSVSTRCKKRTIRAEVSIVACPASPALTIP